MLDGARKPTHSPYVEDGASPDIIPPQNCFGAAGRKKSFIAMRGHRAQSQPTGNLMQGMPATSKDAAARLRSPQGGLFEFSESAKRTAMRFTCLTHCRKSKAVAPGSGTAIELRGVHHTQVVARRFDQPGESFGSPGLYPTRGQTQRVDSRACPATWSRKRKRILTQFLNGITSRACHRMGRQSRTHF